jgi:hypothetical protein
MKMTRLPCICCEGGDPVNKVICADCEARIELREDAYDAMVALVFDLNGLIGCTYKELNDEVHRKVMEIYSMLCDVKIDPKPDFYSR